MHISLVKPTLGSLSNERFRDEARMEPLNLGVLAGLTPAGVDLRLWDDRIDEIDYDEPTDLVAITVEAFTARRAYEIADAFRARAVPVIMGGIHATALPDEVAEHADSVFTGDAEHRWVEAVADAHDGCLAPRYDAGTGPPQPLTHARRDIYEGKGYLPLSLLQYGRGCHFRCEYCAVGSYFDHQHHTRPVEDVIAEIAGGTRRNLFFVDDNLIADHEAAKSLFRALIPLGKRWVSQASIDQVEDAELMRLMVESGCLGNVIGFESLDEANLEQMGKQPNLARRDRYAAAIATLAEHHLQTWAAFVLGYDHDTPESLLDQCEWAIEQHFTFAAWNVLMPYPGTPLYGRLAEQGRLLYDGRWWLHPDYRFNSAAFEPRQMTADQLTETAWDCRRRWSSVGSIVTRALDRSTNMSSLTRFALYLIYNPLFRREAFKRQGLRLGTD